MKKFLLAIALMASSYGVHAQEAVSPLNKGNWLIETSLSPFSLTNTSGLSFKYNDKDYEWSIGGEGGYFIQNNLALKAGLGVLSINNTIGDGSITDTYLSYKVGAKYYFKYVIPLQIDFGGITTSEDNSLFAGIQAGYAWFVKDNIAIEPSLRYDHGLNNTASDIRTVSARIGFSLFF